MVPVVCPCLDSDRWHNIYSLKSQTISSQKTMFSSLTWDHNICKVTKSCTILWTLVYDYYVPLVNLYYCFAIVMVQQTLPVVLCLEHPMKDKRSGYLFNVFRFQNHGAVRDIFFFYKNMQTLLFWQDFVPSWQTTVLSPQVSSNRKLMWINVGHRWCHLSDCWPFLESVFC